MFSAHLDTVPICEGCQPLREGDEVRSANPATGIGADNRTGVSVLLTIIAELKRQMLSHPPLLFCWFVQEEIGLEGSRHLDPQDLSGIAWCCNFDGSSPEKITIGATGGERMEITVHGRASHAGVSPRDGISAIVIASRAIAWLHEGGWLGAIDQPQGKGTANVGVIRGGDATNVVTPEVTIRAEARSHDRAFRQVISDTIIAAFERSASVVKNQKQEAGRVTVSRHVDYDPFRIDETDPVVVAARAAIEAQGREPQLKISDGGLDANWLYRHGVKAVTLGCGQREPHTVSERLNLPDYLTACAAALTMATMPLES